MNWVQGYVNMCLKLKRSFCSSQKSRVLVLTYDGNNVGSLHMRERTVTPTLSNRVSDLWKMRLMLLPSAEL